MSSKEASPIHRRNSNRLGFTGILHGTHLNNGKTRTDMEKERRRLQSMDQPRIENGKLIVPDSYRIPQGGILILGSK